MLPFTSWHWVITSHIGVPNLADVFFCPPRKPCPARTSPYWLVNILPWIGYCLLDYVKLYWLRFWMFLGFGTTWPEQPSSRWILLGLRRSNGRPPVSNGGWKLLACGFCCNVWSKSFQCCCGPRGPHAQVPSWFGWVGHLDFLEQMGYPDRLASFMDLGERWAC